MKESRKAYLTEEATKKAGWFQKLTGLSGAAKGDISKQVETEFRDKEKKSIEESVKAKEKELAQLDKGTEAYKSTNTELEAFRATLTKMNLQEVMGTAAAGKLGDTELHATLQGIKGLKGKEFGTEQMKALRSGDFAAAGLSTQQASQFAAEISKKTVPAAKDVKDVIKKGLAWLSPGDWVVDKDSIANILGGEKGSAIPRVLQKGADTLKTGAGTAMHALAAPSKAMIGAGQAAVAALGGREGTGRANEITIHVKGEGILEKFIDERVVVNVKNGTIVGTQKTKQTVSA